MTSTTAPTNPFIYGRPVQPDEFLNRENELRTIFNRLRNGESTAVIGGPHIGKSSLLLKLADEATQRDYLGDAARGLKVSLLNLHAISTEYSHHDFWQRALKSLRDCADQASLAQQITKIAQIGYPSYSIEDLINDLHKKGLRLVLLLDEFELLLFHPNFQDFSFFAALRALDSYPSFSFVTTSRLSLSALNQHGHDLPGSGGSPLFNTQVELQLGPFVEKTVDILLNQAGDAFSRDDRHFICLVAGHHPYLVQAMAATLLETTGDDRLAYADERFYSRVSFHFDELWHILDDQTRTAALILYLAEIGSSVRSQHFDYGEIDRKDAFDLELRQLAQIGLAQQQVESCQLDKQHWGLWQGEQWTVGCQAFARWVRDVVIARTRVVASYDEWLTNERHRLLLTQEQWDKLVNVTPDTPGLVQLRQTLKTYFSKSELRDLSFDLNVDFEDLPGEAKGDKVRELIAYLERRGRIPELRKACQELRPNQTW